MDKFFEENSGHFRGMYENGAAITVSEVGTIATFPEARFFVKNLEDFQVTNEVFIYKEYNVLLRRNSTVIDVGMNVGLLSLFMASNSKVTSVHAFEPFSFPRKRAAETFSLNPQSASKITVHPFGLSDRNETIKVQVDDGQTIATSIKGHGSGRPETIEVRDAATWLGPIIAGAVTQGEDVILKIDCEGSEFAIFDSLHQAGLFQSINAVMIQWHKNWDYRKSRDDLVAPLHENRYIVFDKTQATDLFAGQMYAVRAA